MKSHHTHPSSSGFTLLEVLIALIITAVGALGLAKMQGLVLVGSKNASSRSMISLQTESLAAVMHANKAYWASAPTSFKATGNTAATTAGATITDPSNVLTATVSTCASATAVTAPVCTPSQMAAYDIQMWATGMDTVFPGYTAQVDCTNSTNQPVSCSINMTWSEKTLAVNKTTATSTGTGSTGTQVTSKTFSAYIKP